MSTSGPFMNYWKTFFDNLETICSIPTEEKEKAMSYMKEVKLKKGAYFGKFDEMNDDFAIIVKGLIKEYYLKSNGQEYIKGFRKEGQTTGHYRSIVLQEKSKMNIECMEDCIFYVAKYKDYEKLLDGHICWYKITKYLDDKEFFIKEDREYQFLMYKAENRYELFQKEHSDLMTRIPQNQIAMYLGIDPSSLNRILAKKKA